MTLYHEDLTPLEGEVGWGNACSQITFCEKCLWRTQYCSWIGRRCPKCEAFSFFWCYLDTYSYVFIKLILNPALIAANYDPLP